VKDKNGQDVAKYHSDQDQADAAQEEESPAFSGATSRSGRPAMSDALCVFRGTRSIHFAQWPEKFPTVFMHSLEKQWRSSKAGITRSQRGAAS